MAKRKVNKSQLIREYQQANPQATPTEVAKAVTAKGHPVSAALVSQALKKGTTKGRRKKARGRKAAAATGRAGAKTVRGAASDQYVLAADFSRACGGIERAMDALAGLKKIAAKL